MITQATESLRDQLTDLASKMSAQIPKSVQQIIREADEQLAASPLLKSSLKVGEAAPSFQLPNATGQIISSADLLKNGSLVLSFYRGGWCPYCNLELRALQQALPDFQRHGANLVAVSPETPDHSLSTVEKAGLSFEVLSDAGNRVARQFGLVFTVSDSLRHVYSQFGIDIRSYNGDHSFELPMPATYVIDQNGTVTYAFVNTDYKRRAEPADIILALKQEAAN